MALPSNDINDLKRGLIIESVDVVGQPGQVVLNPDGTALGAPVGGATSANQDTQITQITDLTNTNSHTGSPELRVYQENHICAQNTTAIALGSNATFTGEWQDCLNYQEVNVSIVSDQNSATNGLVFQWSSDGINVGDTDVFSYYTASGGTNYTPNPSFRYVRMVYTNGSSAQGTFSLMTILRRGATGGSFHRIDSTLKDDADGRLQISVPKLKTAANTYVSQTATTAGNAKVSLEEFESGVSVNNKTQLKVTPFTSAGVEGVNLLPSTNIYNGSKTVATVTATAISTTQAIKSVTVKALSTNTDAVFIGATGVTTSTGIELLSGESVSLDISDLASVYAISPTASQVIRFIAV